MISTISSTVPMPPGSATKASDFSNIVCLRWCMSSVTMSSSRRSKRGFGGFLVHQEARNDAGDLAAGRERAVGDGAHDALGAAAIDEPQAGPGRSRGRAGGRP